MANPTHGKASAIGFNSPGGNGIPYQLRYSYGATNRYKEAPEVIHVTGTLTKAGVSAPVTLLTDAQVGANRRIVMIEGSISNTGGTAWTTTGTKLILQDSAASPVVWENILTAALVANCQLSAAGGVNFTSGAGAVQGYLTQGKGLVATTDADYVNGTDMFLNLMITVEAV